MFIISLDLPQGNKYLNAMEFTRWYFEFSKIPEENRMENHGIMANSHGQAAPLPPTHLGM
jgi:hypothetical protein